MSRRGYLLLKLILGLFIILPSLVNIFKKDISEVLVEKLKIEELTGRQLKKVCAEGICYRDYSFDPIKNQKKDFIAHTMYSAEACILESLEQKYCNTENKIIPNYFKLNIDKIHTLENKIILRTFNLENTPRLGRKNPTVFIGKKYNIFVYKSFFDLINIHTYLLQAVLCIIIPLLILSSGAIKNEREMYKVLKQFGGCLCVQLVFSHIFNNLFVNTGLNFNNFIIFYRFTSLMAISCLMFERIRFRSIFILNLFLSFGVFFIFGKNSPFFTSSYRYIILGLCCYGWFICYSKKQFSLIFFNLCLSHDVATWFGVMPFFTTISMAPLALFPAVCAKNKKLIEDFLITNIYNLKKFYLDKYLNNIRNEIRKSDFDFIELSKTYINAFIESNLVNRVSICHFTDGNPVIYINNRGNCMTVEDGVIPPIFARVFQTGESYWWSRGKDFKSISPTSNDFNYKHKEKFKENDYSCVFPITYNSKVLGVLAISKFQILNFKSLREKKFLTNSIRSSLDLLNRLASIYENKTINSQRLQINKSKNLIIQESMKSKNFEEFCHFSLNALCKDLGLKGLMLRVNKDLTSQVEFFDNDFPIELKEMWLKTPFVMRRENKTGPFPLSYHENRSILIQNFKIFSCLISKLSIELMEKNNTKQVGIIPIKDSLLGGLMVFMDKEKNRPGTLSYNGLEQFQELFSFYSKHFSVKNELKMNLGMLNSFVPNHIREKLLLDNDYKEHDTGYLLMIDLKGSTIISNLPAGKALWLKSANEIKEIIEKKTKHFKLNIQEFKWDAFFISISSKKQSEHKLQILRNFICSLTLEVNEYYHNNFQMIPDFTDKSIPKFRACLVYGDISKGLYKGKTNTWSFIGNEIANLVKMEDVCKEVQKTYDGAFFFVDASISQTLTTQSNNHPEWIKTNYSVSSSKRDIYICNLLWENEVDKAIKKIAS